MTTRNLTAMTIDELDDAREELARACTALAKSGWYNTDGYRTLAAERDAIIDEMWNRHILNPKHENADSVWVQGEGLHAYIVPGPTEVPA